MLDLEQPPPKPPSWWHPYLLGVVLGLLPVSVLILNDLGFLPEVRWPGINDLLILPALLASIAFHEFGHALAGVSSGMGVDGIWVGPVAFIRSGSRWVFQFNLKCWCCGGYKPRIVAADLGRWKYAWMVAGGPLTSLILLSASGFVCSRYGSGTWEWIGTLFWVTAFLLPFSLVPYSAGVNRTDGARLWLMIRHPEQARPWFGALNVISQEARGVRPKEWNSDQFSAMLHTHESAAEYSYCQLLAYYRLMDEGLSDEALAHLENALSASRRAGKLLRQVFFAEAASASAVVRKRPEQARIWRERLCAIQKSKALDGLDAEIAMLEGRYEDALKHLESATSYLKRLGLDSGLVRFAREELLTKEAICRAALSGATS